MRVLFSIISLWLLALHLEGADAPPPSPPSPPSPIDQFRSWLKLTPEERNQAIAEWPEQKQLVLRAKLQVYEQLPPEERERRLTMLELRLYLPSLMTNTVQGREEQMRMIPPRLHEVLRERLARWDSLPSAVQRQVLEHEAALHYFARLRPPLPGQSGEAASVQSQEMERHMRFWRSVSEEERRRLSAQLNEFFELPKQEQNKTLQALHPREREEIEKTLQVFAKLPANQKRVCIESFGKFTRMSAQERNSFLRNAARWQAMSPEERERWKLLVSHLPPLPQETAPLPPALPMPSDHLDKLSNGPSAL